MKSMSTSNCSRVKNRKQALVLELPRIASSFSPMKKLSWDDLQFFAAVARGGGLSAAAQRLGSSPATIGRRMLALEQAVGRPLFIRRQTGYELTADGQSLLIRARTMEDGARTIDDWLDTGGRRPLVRISSGTWTTNFLADNFARLWTPDDPFRIAFKA